MRVLFLGDMDATGFGTVTMDLGRALLALGEDVRFVSQYGGGFENAEEPFRSRTLDLATFTVSGEGQMAGVSDVRPLVPLLRGEASFQHMLSGEEWGPWKPEAVILLGDFTAVRLAATPYLDEFRAIGNVWHYVPIEGIDLPPNWRTEWSVLHPVAMSNFGADQIEKVLGYRPPMVYHGVDTKAFYPVSRMTPIRVVGTNPLLLQTKAACKRYFNINPELTLILRTDANMPRKRYPSMIRGIAPVMARHGEVATLLHTASFGLGGFLPDTLSKYPAAIRARMLVKASEAPSTRQEMLILYNAADLYVSVSAEGFGLTIAEALACGTPAVGLDYSSVPEVIGPAGKTVPMATVVMGGKMVAPMLLDNDYDHFWAGVDELELEKTVEDLVRHKARREDLGRRGPLHVGSNFSWDKAAARFQELIHSHEQEAAA